MIAPLFELTVPGVAQPAGSKRAIHHKTTGRIIVMDANPKSRAWKREVAQVAMLARTGPDLLDGPLVAEFLFVVPRPKGHFGKRGLLPSAPQFPAVRPDALKLARAVEDALSKVVYRDDGQIVREILEKRYGDSPRCEVRLFDAHAVLGGNVLVLGSVAA